MEAKFYKVKCVTNMHMGNGDINFNIVDNEVEKDPVTGFPAMYSSGIKGALREYIETNNKNDEKNLNDIFGKGEIGGQVKFLTGNILLQAVRSADDKQVYYLVTCKSMLDSFFELRKAVGFNDDIEEIEDKAYCSEDCAIESESHEKNNIPDSLRGFLENIVGKENISKVVIISNKDMKEISLPVLARNRLDDKGISEQLWYEEVVPHESIFYFAAISEDSNLLVTLSKNINGKMIQFGADASIGYGLTMVGEMVKEIGHE